MILLLNTCVSYTGVPF